MRTVFLICLALVLLALPVSALRQATSDAGQPYLVTDINQRPTGGKTIQMFNVADRLFLLVDNSRSGCALVESDGTPDGTELLKDLNTFCDGLGDFTVLGSTLFYTAGNRLLQTQGTPQRIADARYCFPII